MSMPYNVGTPWYSVKVKGEYPWPCKPEPKRFITLFEDDVLTKAKDGTYTKHTGICCLNIQLGDDEVVAHDEEVKLVML